MHAKLVASILIPHYNSVTHNSAPCLRSKGPVVVTLRRENLRLARALRRSRLFVWSSGRLRQKRNATYRQKDASLGRSSVPKLERPLAVWSQSLCGAGVVLGTTFFAATLTPTLIPRSFSTQGILAGICFAIGYGCGVLLRSLWRYLELPEPRFRIRGIVNAVIAVVSLAVGTVCDPPRALRCL
jgi:hypothetical protein